MKARSRDYDRNGNYSSDDDSCSQEDSPRHPIQVFFERMKKDYALYGERFLNIYGVDKNIANFMLRGHRLPSTDAILREFPVTKERLNQMTYAEKYAVLIQLEYFYNCVKKRAFDINGAHMTKRRMWMEITHKDIETIKFDFEPNCNTTLEAWLLLQDTKLRLVPNISIINRSSPDTLIMDFPQNEKGSPEAKQLQNILDNLRSGYLTVDLRLKNCLAPVRAELHALKQCRTCFYPSPTVSIPAWDGPVVLPSKTTMNEVQEEAVSRMVAGPVLPNMPFCVFGPPGTGKTAVILEAVLQILAENPKNRVLYTAPSNTTCDNFGVSMLESGCLDLKRKPPKRPHKVSIARKDQIIRINSEFRSTEAPESLRDYCETDFDKIKLFNSRLVIATIHMSSHLNNRHLSREGITFTHVFIDEANQATEPMCLIPYLALKRNDRGRVMGKLIMAGDPYQLGPVVQFDSIKPMGLNRSPIERLLSRKLYTFQAGPPARYNPSLVSKLIYSYRAVPELLVVPNVLFYGKELECGLTDSQKCQMKKTSERFMRAYAARNGMKKCPEPWPALFIPVTNGKCGRKELDTSRENPTEIDAVLVVVLSCIDAGFEPSDIGVLSPYRLQTEQIYKMLVKKLTEERAQHILCGSAERFEGQERRIMIISTVLTPVANDGTGQNKFSRYRFIFDDKRFNVASTRAKELNILIGHPDVLELDKNWKELIDRSGKFRFSGSVPGVRSSVLAPPDSGPASRTKTTPFRSSTPVNSDMATLSRRSSSGGLAHCGSAATLVEKTDGETITQPFSNDENGHESYCQLVNVPKENGSNDHSLVAVNETSRAPEVQNQSRGPRRLPRRETVGVEEFRSINGASL